jgi:hypothetical protein
LNSLAGGAQKYAFSSTLASPLQQFDQTLYTQVRNELVNRFGGITAYTRAPVHGLWQESEQIVRDDSIIYEIMVETLEEEWWRG